MKVHIIGCKGSGKTYLVLYKIGIPTANTPEENFGGTAKLVAKHCLSYRLL